ncbi:hypothetical protein [Methylobacterium sp. E-066]|uniref:hypothetical protein n=1 Tax=Methylobacterium sp. E-066 TaxID=2836584 RepID=UPI001FBB2383|nr:hypothetical protein [Methylobacterium sp. E-066]MCJ2141570.1 hypothetical protein [Methylobacterium sp. E-066]
MQNLKNDYKLRQWVVWSLIAIPLGGGIALYCGWHLLKLDAPWASGDGRWMGLFMGVLFVGMGCMALWNWLFARPLTPEEERLRDMMRDWQQERERFPGGGGF